EVKSFENEAFIFPAVHHFTKFCLLTLGGRKVQTAAPMFVFFLKYIEETHESSRYFSLSYEDILRMSPLAPVCPTFRSSADAEIARNIYGRLPCLGTNKRNGERYWTTDY